MPLRPAGRHERRRQLRYFATAVPGLGPILARELATVAGVEVDPARQFDGRSDLVSFSAAPSAALTGLRTSEDVFVEVSSAVRAPAPQAVVGRLLDERALERALSVYGARVRPLRARMTFRVVARVLSERDFPRTALRDELARAVQRARPRWRVADPATLELWALESQPGRMLLGVRLSGAAMRHRDGRDLERPGALRPTVAAAMVLLAGGPGSAAAATLLDPCCGSGTIPAEAAAAGWIAVGADLDRAAIATARRNLGASARLLVADARRLPVPGGRVAALVANLPFGRRYGVQGPPAAWFAAVLGEFARVTSRGAAVALLVPGTEAFQRSLDAQPALALHERFEPRLLGMRTTLWRLGRR